MATNIPTGIVDFLTHPALSQLVRSTSYPTPLFNPYSGSGDLQVTLHTDPLFIPTASAFGFRWAVNSAPQSAGRRNGAVLEYEDAFFSFALHYVLADHSDFIGDTVRTGMSSGFWMFNVALPLSLSYWIDPGWTMHFDWLIGAPNVPVP